jgi:hypothetical protein
MVTAKKKHLVSIIFERPKVTGSSPDEVDFSIDLILPAAIWPWCRLSLWQKWVPGIFLGGKGRPARKVDNLTAIREPTTV